MLKFDPGSFKDPEGRVFFSDSQVFRTMLADAGQLGLDSAQVGETVLRQRFILVISYPFEWSFDMLRNGALVTLDLLDACLAKYLILKDATAFNVTPDGRRMKFLDVLSIDDYREGGPWGGYAKFCREFLFSLLLTSYNVVEFQPWFRGTQQGCRCGNSHA